MLTLIVVLSVTIAILAATLWRTTRLLWDERAERARVSELTDRLQADLGPPPVPGWISLPSEIADNLMEHLERLEVLERREAMRLVKRQNRSANGARRPTRR